MSDVLLKNDIESLLRTTQEAFHIYKKCSIKERADLMRAISGEIEQLGQELIDTAHEETNLPLPRLIGEKQRTIFQWLSYADFLEQGTWLDARIDTALPDRTPPKADLRKMMVPLGPVVVFGASNFPFAFSTAGGDTASALAAGCPVVVKAHPHHPKTSALMSAAILRAVRICNMPEGVFTEVQSEGFEEGIKLVSHPAVKAVSFTGSFSGGMALFELAHKRKEPIPVFAEMGSMNPVFLLQDKMTDAAEALAKQCAASITIGVGQFCTKPGLIVGVAGSEMDLFMDVLKAEIAAIAPAHMLHTGIAGNYSTKSGIALEQKGVEKHACTDQDTVEGQGRAIIAKVSAAVFLENSTLHEEVFGPYSLIIQCVNQNEMMQVAALLDGQLTTTIMATEADIATNEELVSLISTKCGRMLFNGVPTGVEVCLSMHHGGPFPATTNSRFTSVGADGIKRFVRPLCLQSWPDAFLPDELKNANPLGIWRTVNNVLTNEPI